MLGSKAYAPFDTVLLRTACSRNPQKFSFCCAISVKYAIDIACQHCSKITQKYHEIIL